MVLLDLYEAMSSGDAGRVEAFYSLEPGCVFVGTDDSEFWTDSACHNADVRSYFDGSRGRLSWSAGEAIALEEESVGWTVDRPTISMPDGTSLRTRVTLVWHRQNDTWAVVHSHASVGG
jgi:hypothetical protein